MDANSGRLSKDQKSLAEARPYLRVASHALGKPGHQGECEYIRSIAVTACMPLCNVYVNGAQN